MRKWLLMFVMMLLTLSAGAQDFRPPAVPLVVSDPYFSVWSMADHLTDDVTRHWTGTPQSIASLVRIDGKTYRIMGDDPRNVPALQQKHVRVLPTRTIYSFVGGGIGITLAFMTPVLPYDLDVMSRPVTYVTWTARSMDGRTHAVSLYFDVSAQLVVNTLDQDVTASRYRLGGLTVLREGSERQPVLKKSGDNLRIDWGYLYLAAPPDEGVSKAIVDWRRARSKFAGNGSFPASDDVEPPRPAGQFDGPALACSFNLGQVGSASVSRHIVLAYDEEFSIEFLYRWLRPYWRRNGATAGDLIKSALADYDSLEAQCERFDKELMADLTQAGGEQYALLCALAYRQSFGAQELAANYDGNPLFFPKENSSNGDVSTVDVIYPTSPILLLFNPNLLKASMTPVFEYVASGRWPFPWAPHDLGVYPHANGHFFPPNVNTKRVERVMAVEESGNMILMAAAIAQIEGNAAYAAKYWPILKGWAQYLKEKGLDPENQLCTDDFTGYLAHNANLSVKAICALGAYGKLCKMLGKQKEAAEYTQIAHQYAHEWVHMASDGDHTRLAFDKPGTWSMKYNMVWDKLLGLNLFSSAVTQREVAFYIKKENQYGTPLDSRALFTKLDWLTWSATLANNRGDFEKLISGAYKFADQTPDRSPLGDLYYTQNAKVRTFRARSVVGGLFIKMLANQAMWNKWAGKALAHQSKN